jgi:hypothetical protein
MALEGDLNPRGSLGQVIERSTDFYRVYYRDNVVNFL